MICLHGVIRHQDTRCHHHDAEDDDDDEDDNNDDEDDDEVGGYCLRDVIKSCEQLKRQMNEFDE